MKNIGISSASTEDVYSKLDMKANLHELLIKIDFSKYISKYERLFVIFQCFPKDIKTRKVETFKKIRRKTKTLELYLVLDYDKIMNGNDTENLAHIKDVFIHGCGIFLKPMKGFDFDAFNKELIKHTISTKH